MEGQILKKNFFFTEIQGIGKTGQPDTGYPALNYQIARYKLPDIRP